MTLGALRLAITPESAPEAVRTTTSQSLELADLRAQSRSGADTVQLGGLRFSVDYRDLDLATLTAGYGSLLELIESGTETPDIETLRRTIERLLQASGQVEMSVVMTDFAAICPVRISTTGSLNSASRPRAARPTRPVGCGICVPAMGCAV
jgi:hypothetical protein